MADRSATQVSTCQPVRARTVVPDRLPRPWRHPLLGYFVAVLAQLAAVGLTLRLAHVSVWAYPNHDALSILVITFVALR
jgi:hypothetical protein